MPGLGLAYLCSWTLIDDRLFRGVPLDVDRRSYGTWAETSLEKVLSLPLESTAVVT